MRDVIDGFINCTISTCLIILFLVLSFMNYCITDAVLLGGILIILLEQKKQSKTCNACILDFKSLYQLSLQNLN